MRRMLVLGMLAGCLATAAAAVGQPSPGASASGPDDETVEDHSTILQGRVLRSAKYGYSLCVPGDDWTLHPYKTSPMQHREADAELSNRGGGFALTFCEPASLNLKAFADLCLDNLKRNAERVEILSRVDRPIGSMPSTVVRLKATVDKMALCYVVVYTVGPKYMYQVMGWCPEPLFADQAPLFEAFASSLDPAGRSGDSPVGPSSGTTGPAPSPLTTTTGR